jgi:hypothetical protein
MKLELIYLLLKGRHFMNSVFSSKDLSKIFADAVGRGFYNH